MKKFLTKKNISILGMVVGFIGVIMYTAAVNYHVSGNSLQILFGLGTKEIMNVKSLLLERMGSILIFGGFVIGIISYFKKD